MNQLTAKTIVLAIFALFAFAGNSVLCRFALAQEAADPAGFTAVRLLSGAVTLMLLLALSRSDAGSSKGSWLAGGYLFAYAILFSFAYVTLDTATGALILFGTVQLTMILVTIFRGHRLQRFEWLGFLLAVSGLVYLLLPELAKPSMLGFSMMLLAGVAWAGYTFMGQGSKNALADTAYNFARTLPMLAISMVPLLSSVQLSQSGILLAIASGALTSGVGYALWYSALSGLSTTQAAVIQLLVPVIAALGGVLFANELLTDRLILSAVLVLGGIMLIILTKQKENKS